MKWIYKTNEDNSARFVLGQIINPTGKTLLCFGINPSTASPGCLDNTIRKIISISKYNGYENWIMLNVYPQRATNPKDIHSECNEDLVRENLNHINEIVSEYSNCDILFAYGNLISKRKYLKGCLDQIIALLCDNQGKKIKVIKLTKANNPVHPLYQASKAVLVDHIF